MSSLFIDDKIRDEIRRKVVEEMFPRLNNVHQSLLLNMLIKLMNLIAIKFRFNIADKRDVYEYQFRQNNYQDPKGLLLLLLPFVKNRMLKGLDELFVDERYSNIQYGRCKREGDGVLVQFKEEYLEHNFNLLKDTVQNVANKLYVNWMDILPYPRVSSEDSKAVGIIKETQDLIDSRALRELDVCGGDDDDTYGGITVADIYDVISNDLYDSVKSIKWLIYDMKISESSNKTNVYLQVLDAVLPIDECLNGKRYNELTIEQQNSFVLNWENLINSVNAGSSVGQYTNEVVTKLLKTVMQFFDASYKEVGRIREEEGYVRLGVRIAVDDEDEENELSTAIDKYMVVRTAKSVKPRYIWDYFLGVLNELKGTYYGKLILKTVDGKVTVKSSELYNKVPVDFKNIYNFSKSVVNTFDSGKRTRGAIFWKMMTGDQKTAVLTKLNWPINTETPWFNIARYIKLVYGAEGADAKRLNNVIFKGIIENLAFIVYDVLVTKGVLSEFIPERRLTDEKLVGRDIKARMKEVISHNKDRIKEGYYYLTGTKYEDLIVQYGKEDKKASFPTYVHDQLPGGWTTTYAMNWVSQIGFFHHYLNNRVIFVTGATGVGKSTQTPKLLMYALKMIDYKDDGSIICTQPRIRPTEDNASQIATQLGVPIRVHNKVLDDNLAISNWYVQYHHGEGSHKKNKVGHLTLKLVTDGILLNEIQKNPLLKGVHDGESTTKNRYDVVIVDETHEHNNNMDLIMTLMKYTSYYNNDIKLVLISATMDEDEPYYRRFYREVNDNRMYPFNTLLERCSLDRINVDRRIHISPPEKTTRWKVTDIYEPASKVEDIVLKVVKGSTEGDVLVFQPGQTDIDELVTTINPKLPSHIIALPYYSRMSSAEKVMVEKLDKPNIVRDKLDPTKRVPAGTYKRVIIVATNIAEASITIDSLRFVVDTGTQKTDEYDYKLRSKTLKLTDISETSRVQRRGRVGRVAPGTVYYLYEKDKMLKNRTQFKIAVSDISENLFEMLQTTQGAPLFPADKDPNSSTVLVYKDQPPMIKKQYFNGTTLIKYYGNPSHYDYENNKPPHTYFGNGYSKQTLDDPTGTFYIIHPEELCIVRDITGKIIKTTESPNCTITLTGNKIESKKMETFWQIMEDRLMAFPHAGDILKTDYGVNLTILKRNLELEDASDIQPLISYLYSRKYAVSEDLLKLIPFINLLSRSIKTIITGAYTEDGKYRVNIDKIKSIYSEQEGDGCALVKMVDKLFKYVSTTTTNTPANLRQQKKMFIEKQFTKLDKDTYRQLNKLFITDRLDTSKQELTKSELTELYDPIKVMELSIKNEPLARWCQENYLNYDRVLAYLKDYGRLKKRFYIYEQNPKSQKDDYDTQVVEFSWFDKHLTKITGTASRCRNIIYSLLHGYSFNIARKVGDKFRLIPDPTYSYNIKRIAPHILDTFIVDGMEYILFLSRDEDKERGGLGIIHKVTPKMIMEVASHIYGRQNPNLPNTYTPLIWSSFNELDNRKIFKEYLNRRSGQMGGGHRYKKYILKKD